MTTPRTHGASLEGKVAVVTGAARGIGLATATLFVREGATVVLADLDAKSGRTATDALTAHGHAARFFHVDVSREEDVCAMIEFARREHGTLDILVNNAGVAGENASTTQIGKDTWDRTIATNLTGTFLAMKHGIAAMLEGRGGCVINNASVLGLVGLSNQPAYSASKGGVIALTRTAAMEFAKKGVRVNCICPGFVESPMLMGTDAAAAERGAMLKAAVPVGRLGTADEIAEIILFLASARSSFMTGAIIPVDGGYVAR